MIGWVFLKWCVWISVEVWVSICFVVNLMVYVLFVYVFVIGLVESGVQVRMVEVSSRLWVCCMLGVFFFECVDNVDVLIWCVVDDVKFVVDFFGCWVEECIVDC